MGAHQSDRRLCLAAEPQAGGREVSAAKAARKTLAYDFFRFLYSPPKDLGRSQFGFGMGTVQSASAMAIGLNHYVNDSTVVTFRGAIGTSKAVSGASFGVVKGW
ncbi:YadA-like family protein [Pseudomonas aeruginosa]|uniref:YadA-like family protein n=1 Tax=Pseudomonas aeruginosa TaxID=287 RepID=UPI002ACB0B40|nr:YadA-like family protein [Pseudomonas aeruginosa]